MTTVEVVTSIARLTALRQEWSGLASAAATPLLDHDWILSAVEAFHDDGGLRIVVVREASGAPTGIAPLTLATTPSGRRLVLPGASKLLEPGGWLFESRSAVASLVAPALALGTPLLLCRIPEASELTAALHAATRGRATTVTRTTAPSLGVPTIGGWDQYLRSLSSRVTVNLPRLRRKAERVLGPMKIAEIEAQPGEVDALLETLMLVEDSGWKHRAGSSLARRPDLRAFFGAYCRRAAVERRLRVTTLSFGSAIGAVEVSVDAYGRRWQLKIGYHETLAPYYPGLHLTRASLQSAFNRGLRTYEFLGSAETWEQQWRPEVRSYQLVAVYPWNPAGVIGACRDLSGALRRRVYGMTAGKAALA